MFNHIKKTDQIAAMANALMQYMGVTVLDVGGVYEVIKDTPPTGDYTDPILWQDGDTVFSGKWYYTTDKDMPHEAIASGVPSGFYDASYFDYVEEVPPNGR